MSAQPPNDIARLDHIGADIVNACFSVHRALGPGLLEGIYEQCVAAELEDKGIMVQRQVLFPVTYRGIRMEAGYRVDLLVNECVLVEIKAVAETLPVHRAQLLTYLRLSGCRLGYLINFNNVMLRNGIRRMVL
jgi:GxxExxY protein